MSLKAKIEAVIYAAEEPVTLAQLAGLFGVEAAAELRRREGAQSELPLEEAGAGDAGVLAGDAELPRVETIDPDALRAEVLGAIAAEAVVAEEADTPVGEDLRAAAAPGDEAGGKADAVAGRREERERARRVRELLRGLLEEMVREYATGDRGLEIREVAGGYRMATKPEYHDAVRGFARTLKPPLKLTLQALETLAVVAYKQPVTAPEVSEIRGVDSGGVLGSLMGRKLVQTAGRKQVIGRPILYKTTKDFLLRFGLKDVAELPSIEEFEKMAGEMAQEEISMTAEGMGAGSDVDYGVESPGVTGLGEAGTGEDVVGTGDGGGSVDSPPAGSGLSVPQADGDSVDLPPEDAAPLDGRMAGLDPPDVEPGGNDGVDSPALDAEVQSGEKAGS